LLNGELVIDRVQNTKDLTVSLNRCVQARTCRAKISACLLEAASCRSVRRSQGKSDAYNDGENDGTCDSSYPRHRDDTPTFFRQVSSDRPTSRIVRSLLPNSFRDFKDGVDAEALTCEDAIAFGKN